MNKRKMDSMFREKLYGHQVTPGTEAWTKLKGNLDSDRKKALLIYWRVAAVIILLLTSLFFLYKVKSTGMQGTVAGKQEEVVPKTVDESVNEHNFPETRGDDEIAAKVEIPAGQPKKLLKNKEVTAESNKKPAGVGASTERKTLAKRKTSTRRKTSNVATIAEAPATKQPEKSKVLANHVQTLEKPAIAEAGEIKKQPLIDVVESIAPNTSPDYETTQLALVTTDNKQREDNDYLAQNTLPNITITFKKEAGDLTQEAAANSQELSKVKKFAFKKFISLAKDIKTGEATISTLREKKDELIALNFNKKRMPKTQNKK